MAEAEPLPNLRNRKCIKPQKATFLGAAHDQAEPEKIKWQRQSHCQFSF
jgi:hypothetical protein